MKRIVLFSVAGLCVLLAAFLFFMQRPIVAPPVGYAGTPIVPPKAAGDALLTDQDDRPAHVIASGYPLTLLFFGYTHCPDECPLAMASLAKAYRKLPSADRARTRVVFVTVDPARDAPAVMRKYVRAFDPHFVGLTGSLATLAPVWKSYGVEIDRKTRELSHGDAIYAIDGTSHVVLIYPPDATAASIAADAAKLTASS
jgi:protein SCO1/2